MAAPKRLLFATDFSRTSTAAYQVVARLASNLGASVTVLHVVPPIYLVEPADEDAVAFEAQRDAVERLAKLRPRPAQTLVRRGVVHEVITAQAQRLRADLIVIASDNRDRLRRSLLGGVAEAVIRHAACPVLTIPARSR